jgi:transcription elongation factor GreB
MDRPNYITPAGYTVLREEYELLLGSERPKLVEVISWAAGNGDRSENGDYIYGRKRLREIDRRLGWLSRRMKAAKVVERVLTLVGDDETDAGNGRIGWNSPFARALRGAAIGDVRRVDLPAGEREYEVVAIAYP